MNALLPEWLNLRQAADCLRFRTLEPLLPLIDHHLLRSRRDPETRQVEVRSEDVARFLATVTPEHPYCSRQKAAEVLGCSVRTVDRALAAGRLRCHTLRGGQQRLLDGLQVGELAMVRLLMPKLTTTQLNRYLSVTRT